MATQQFGTDDALAVKLWSKKLAREVPKALELAPLIGKGSDSIIRLETKMNKSAGDRVRVTFTPRLDGVGVGEGETLEGREESRLTYTDDITIGELYHAVDTVTEGSMSYQRTDIARQLREDAMPALRDWFAERISASFFVHSGGYQGNSITVEGTNFDLTGTKGEKFYGFNAPLAATNILYGGTGNTADEDLASGDTFTLELIDEVKTRAHLLNPKIQPIKVNGTNKYIMYLHPWQVYSLRTNTADGQWQDLSKRGPEHASRIYQGAIGEHNGVILRMHEHVAPGFNSSTNAELPDVRRAVLLGKNACCLAYGMGAGQSKYFWREQLTDYERKRGIGAGSMWGMKKAQFNSKDWGCFVVATYAAAPA